MFETEHDKKMALELYKKMLPVVILRLLKMGLLDKDKLHDRNYLAKIIEENPNVIDEMPVITTLHEDFIDAAKEALDVKKIEVAIVLLAVAIEQNVNFFYRNLLAGKILFDNDEITEIIRSNNIGPKIGWLLALVSGWEISTDLKKRILDLMELRNQIVHYKASPSIGFDDKKGGSHNAVMTRIENLDFDALLSIPDELSTEFSEILEHVRNENSSNYKLAKEAAEFYISKSIYNTQPPSDSATP